MLQEAWLELFHNDQYVVASYGYVKGYYADRNDIYSTFTGYLFAPNIVSSPTVEGSLIG